MLSGLIIESPKGEVFQHHFDFQNINDSFSYGNLNFDYLGPVQIESGSINPAILDDIDELSLNSPNRVFVNLEISTPSGINMCNPSTDGSEISFYTLQNAASFSESNDDIYSSFYKENECPQSQCEESLMHTNTHCEESCITSGKAINKENADASTSIADDTNFFETNVELSYNASDSEKQDRSKIGRSISANCCFDRNATDGFQFGNNMSGVKQASYTEGFACEQIPSFHDSFVQSINMNEPDNNPVSFDSLPTRKVLLRSQSEGHEYTYLEQSARNNDMQLSTKTNMQRTLSLTNTTSETQLSSMTPTSQSAVLSPDSISGSFSSSSNHQSEDSSSSYGMSPSPLLPTTLPSHSRPSSPEVSYASLPETLCELEKNTPAASSRPRASSNRRKRGRKLWEFLLDLLGDPESNPSIIRWENTREGVFRLTEQEMVAKKWGQRREKDNLSYDYFARALRYHYKSRMLISVPEKKLVYKFGPKVMAQLNK